MGRTRWRLFPGGCLKPNVTANQALLLAGSAPTEIFPKPFWIPSCSWGGCGCALSFVIALCLVSRKSHNRKIAYVALPSAVFNISEIAVFGFPDYFQFHYGSPFYPDARCPDPLSAFFQLPPTCKTCCKPVCRLDGSVSFSGYKATGSIAGSFLQLVNLLIGILIYIPFIRREREKGKPLNSRGLCCVWNRIWLMGKSGVLPVFQPQISL